LTIVAALEFCALPSDRRMLFRIAGIAGVLAIPALASAQSKIYPPGTDCANQPTIAERLLCGRQEFRRHSGTAAEQPTESPAAPLDGNRPFPDPPTPTTDYRPAPEQQQVLPRTASPNH
jgi:hypothetical protein